MNKQTVGLENLPNIYVKKIYVTKVESINPLISEFEVNVVVNMVDDSMKPSWYGRIDGLQLKCSIIQDERIDLLDSGELSLYDINEGEITTVVESCDELIQFKEEDGYKYYKKSFSFKISSPGNANVYVATFIGDLDFGIDQFNKFYGPMSGERIFVGGEVNKSSGYFYYPDTNEEYGGPVHINEQAYMEGSEHVDSEHSELVYVPEENFKIIYNEVISLNRARVVRAML